jgi:XTP/dITP diphosphohydrolase
LGKLFELRPLFAAGQLDAIDLDAAGIVEDGAEQTLEAFDTFVENALAKARYFHALSGLPTVADDSGLEVAALGGAPGVRSKRWSGRTDLHGIDLDRANNALLLQSLAPHADRYARYVCVAAYVAPGEELTCRGEAVGRILQEPRGSAGFGYDPLFESAELGMTYAEMDTSTKERISHRGRAFRQLITALQQR